MAPLSSHPASTGRSVGFTLLELMIVLTILTVAGAMFAGIVTSRAGLQRSLSERAEAAEGARRAIERLANTPFEEVWVRYNAQADDDPGGEGTASGHRFAVPGLTPLDGVTDGCVGTIVFPSVFATTSDAGESAAERDLREQAEKLREKLGDEQEKRAKRRDKLVDELEEERLEREEEALELWLDSLPEDERDAIEDALEAAQDLAEDLADAAEELAEAEAEAEKDRLDAEEDAAKELAKRREEFPYWQLREDADFPALGMPRDLNGDGVITPRDHAEHYRILPVEIRIEWQSRTGPSTFLLHTILGSWGSGAWE